MSQMSNLSIELQQLQSEAIEAAIELEERLRDISNLLWGPEGEGPLFRATPEVLSMVSDIQTIIDAPVKEIKGTV